MKKSFFEKYKNAKKALAILIFVLFLNLLLSIFLPSREEFASILTVKIANDKQVDTQKIIHDMPLLKQQILKILDGCDK